VIRSTLLFGYSKLARQLGGHPARLLRASRIDPRAERDGESYVSFSALCDLLERTALETGCEHFGLRLSQAQGISSLGPLGFAMQNCATVGEALAEWERFQRVHMRGARTDLRQPGDVAWCVYHVDEPGALGTRQKIAQALGLAVNVVRSLCGPGWNPSSVRFAHSAPAAPGEYRRTFRAPVLWDQDADCIEFPPGTLERPIERSNPELRRLLDRHLLEMQASVTERLDERVRNAVRSCLAQQDCSIERVAARLGTSPRTLQRQLRQEGRSFSRLLEDVRIQAARRHLANSRLPLTQLAAILGYSELSAFSRAFRRSCGVSPRRWQSAVLGSREPRHDLTTGPAPPG